MTLQRQNPLPKGSYWIDVFDKNIPKFDGWALAFQPLGVHVDVSESFPATDTQLERNWYKFTIQGDAVVPWDAKTFGFPTIADASITSSADTVQRPDLPQDTLDRLSNWTEQTLGVTGTAGKFLVFAAILGGGIYALNYLLLGERKRKKE